MRDRKEHKPSKILRAISENKKIVFCIVIGVYIGVEILLFCLFRADLENAYYISQLIGGLFVVGGLVVSILQYTASCYDATVLRDQEKKIKAAEMANQFQSDIIPLIKILVNAYANSSLKEELLPKIERMKLEMFNQDEILKVITEEDRTKCYYALYAGYLKEHCLKENILHDENGEVTGYKFTDEQKMKAEKNIDDCILNLANKLEYFSICFNSGIADEDTVYQSLHSAFFDCVHMLYVFIFYANTSEHDRFFSNISSLYVRWRDWYDTLIEQENDEINKMKKRVNDKIVVKSKK